MLQKPGKAPAAMSQSWLQGFTLHSCPPPGLSGSQSFSFFQFRRLTAEIDVPITFFTFYSQELVDYYKSNTLGVSFPGLDTKLRYGVNEEQKGKGNLARLLGTSYPFTGRLLTYILFV